MRTTNADRQNHAWFALADTDRCRLLCCRLTEHGKPHVDEYEALENTFPEREHLRPQTMDGMTHDVEEKEQRFAGVLVGWLQARVEKHEIDHLVVFVPPGLLGVLRKGQLGLSNGHIKALEGNLMRLEAGELAEHPMIRNMVRTTHEE